MTQKIPIAVIGAGAIGRLHIRHLLDNEALSLVAIADPTEAGLDVAAAIGVPGFADHRALLDEIRPAGVIVATPNTRHVPIALDCVARGIPVLVEKPVADTVEDAGRLVDASEASGVPVLVGHHRRHNPIIGRARELIDAGRLGRILTVNAMSTLLKPDSYFDVAWRREPGGGPVLINLIHDIDLLRFLVGEIESVQAVDASTARGHPVEDSAAAVVTFANGAIGTLVVSDAVAAPWSWDLGAGEADHYPSQSISAHRIAGTRGSLSLPDLTLWHYAGPAGWHDELTREQTVVHRGDPYARQLAHFAALIDGTAPLPLCSARDGARTLAATRAVLTAARDGGRVVLNGAPA